MRSIGILALLIVASIAASEATSLKEMSHNVMKHSKEQAKAKKDAQQADKIA